jgi:arylsulfatase A-like enzyme
MSDPAIARDMPAEDLEQLKLLYDREVRALDAQVARLLEAVRAREPGERILVALVSDHGDEFFEHGNKGHNRTLFEESVRVPWIVRLPEAQLAGRRITAAVSLEDVAPTLLALAGVPPLEQATGRDLSAAMRGEASPTRPALLTFGTHAALRGEDWKLLVNARTGDTLYFDLTEDPGEQRPLKAPRDKVELLRRRLEDEKAYSDALPWWGDAAVELDPETRARLRELGYVP